MTVAVGSPKGQLHPDLAMLARLGQALVRARAVLARGLGSRVDFQNMPGRARTAKFGVLLAVLLFADVFFLPYYLWALAVAGTGGIGGWVFAAGSTALIVFLLWATYRTGRALIASIRDGRTATADNANPS